MGIVVVCYIDMILEMRNRSGRITDRTGAVWRTGIVYLWDEFDEAAGEKMKNILSLLTRNVFIGVLAGAATTAVLQSSSATTVMVIGFVTAGLMNLKQAISIIIGANIGTTITAQLVAFQIGDYAWIFVISGFIMYFFLNKNEKVMDIGQTIFSFGVLFVGLNIMGDAMEPLSKTQLFADIMLKVSDSPALGVVVGAFLTAIIQSSSASIAVLQNLASTAGPDGVTSIVGLVGAIPILFGTNIGTTVTALLASIGGSVNAKRTAIAHTLFNVGGTLLFIWFTPYIAEFIQAISPDGNELNVISRQIANAHLCFNIATTIVFIPLIGGLVRVVEKLIPGHDAERDPMDPIYLDYNLLDRPFAAIHMAKKELARMAQISSEMVSESLLTTGQMVLRLGLATVIVVGSSLILKEKIDLFTYILYLIAASRLYDPLSGAMANMAELFGVNLQVKRLKEIQEYPLENGQSITPKDMM